MARIDSQSLQLRKENSISEIQYHVLLADFGTQVNGDVKILSDDNAPNLLSEGDKDRITQVIHNLINRQPSSSLMREP